MKARSLLLAAIALAGAINLVNAHLYSFDDQEISVQHAQANKILLNYFDVLLAKNVLDKNNLEYVLKQDELVNLISETDICDSHEKFVHRKQIDKILARSAGLLNPEVIRMWARKKLEQLREHAVVRDTIREKTQGIYTPMTFVKLPEGRYESPIDGHTVEIPEGVEIQETLVTQYQWTKIMGDNPSSSIDGPDSEEVVIDGKKIRMRANGFSFVGTPENGPVENVSYEQVQEFLKRLNEQDNDHCYGLPSVGEYIALLQVCLGKDWINQLSSLLESPKKMSNTTQSGKYLEYDKQRVWDVVGTVWQWTRDKVRFKLRTVEKAKAHLVFGTSYVTNKISLTNGTDLLRPIIYKDSKSKTVGLRLIRYPKNMVIADRLYTYESLAWDRSSARQDSEWEWYKSHNGLMFFSERLRWMIDHKERYSDDIRHTLNILIHTADLNICGAHVDIYSNCHMSNEKIIAYFKQKNYLWLAGYNIQDITPLQYLSSLESLTLDNNQIVDISPLLYLPNLKHLRIMKNPIRDRTIVDMLQKKGVVVYT